MLKDWPQAITPTQTPWHRRGHDSAGLHVQDEQQHLQRITPPFHPPAPAPPLNSVIPSSTPPQRPPTHRRGQDSVIARIEQRIAEWTHLPPSHGEALQVRCPLSSTARLRVHGKS